MGGVHWTLDLLSHFHVQYLGFGLGALLLAVLGRARWAAVVALLVSILAGQAVAPLWGSPGQSADTGGPSARLVALNVLTTNREHGDVTQWLLQQNADVIVAQEVDERWARALDSALDGHRRLPTDTLRSDNFGIAIYVAEGWGAEDPTVHWTELELPWLEVVIHRGDLDLRVFGVHTIPPIGARNYRSRGEQLMAAVTAAASSPEPALIAGDFNATIWSSALREALDGQSLRPACLGSGLWGTWHSKLMFTGGILIDHVLVDERLAILSHRVGKHVGSDHRGIVVDVASPGARPR